MPVNNEQESCGRQHSWRHLRDSHVIGLEEALVLTFEQRPSEKGRVRANCRRGAYTKYKHKKPAHCSRQTKLQSVWGLVAERMEMLTPQWPCNDITKPHSVAQCGFWIERTTRHCGLLLKEPDGTQLGTHNARTTSWPLELSDTRS